MPLPRITYKRQLVQALLITAALLLPFVSISGRPFLRMDIADMTLFMAGIPLRIDQFYLVLLVLLLLVALFLLTTALLGRVWCGWFCPQTVFNDLAELLARRFKAKVPPFTASLIENITAFLIASFIAFNLFCWFLPPAQVVTYLQHFPDHLFIFAFFLLFTMFGYLNLILVKRSFCRSYCPYGRFQTALMDDGTLNLSFLEEGSGLCMRCNACVITCPMGIDIRNGFQVECIGCGRCIDACRAVMEKKLCGTGLIDYRFGVIKGTRFKLGNTTIALLIVSLLLAAGIIWGVAGRNQSALAVQRVATANVRTLSDGSTAHPWRAIIGNRTETTQLYTLRLADEGSGSVDLLGQIHDIKVASNQHREIIFMIHIAKNTRQPDKIEIQLLNGNLPAASVTISP